MNSLAAWDPFSAATMADPLPFYKALRDAGPIHYFARYDTFFLARFEEVWQTLRIADNVLLPTEGNLPTPAYLRERHNTAPPALASTEPMAPGPMLHSPWYERMRQAHIAPLRPVAVRRLAGKVEDIARTRLAELVAGGSFDLIADYAAVCAARMVCHLFGIAEAAAEAILAEVNAMTRFDPATGGVDIAGFFVRLKAIIVPVVAARRAAGAGESNALVDGLLAWRDGDGRDGDGHDGDGDGGTERSLTDTEIADQLVCVMVGGLESVAKVTGQGIMELWTRPDQLAAVRADLDANLPVAIEEMIRFCAPAQYTFRTAHRDLVIAGQPVRAGQRVACLLHSAAHDAREFAAPEEFVWNRSIDRVISFGLGQHHCIGKHLAKLELVTLVREFLETVNEVEFRMDAARRNPGAFQAGWTNLPVRVTPRAGTV